MIAALYVETGGVYFDLPDVDPWDEARDARLYTGPWPVVAHPPCNRWSIMAQCRPETRWGDDGGCFAAALDAVRSFGGVLEHPAHTRAWRYFGLTAPAERGWTRTLFDSGWTCCVDQANYGHTCRKWTWLYYVGDNPPELIWGGGPKREHTVRLNHRHDGGRSRTPVEFRDALIGMARAAELNTAHAFCTKGNRAA